MLEYPYIVALKKQWAHLGTCGAAYYNFLTIIWYYSKMLSDTVVKKNITDTPLVPALFHG